MIYVINFEDGGGQEFFLEPEGNLIRLSDMDAVEPQKFKTNKQVMKKMDQMRAKYSRVNKIYALEVREFEARRKIVQQEKEQRRKERYSHGEVYID